MVVRGAEGFTLDGGGGDGSPWGGGHLHHIGHLARHCYWHWCCLHLRLPQVHLLWMAEAVHLKSKAE